MTLNEKMTRLADAIRSKSGYTSAMNMDKMTEQVLAINSSIVDPDGEDLTEVLYFQDDAIANIEGQLDRIESGSSGSGTSVETCTVTFNDGSAMYTNYIFYTGVDENGQVNAKFEIDFTTPHIITVVKNSYLYLSSKLPYDTGVTDVPGWDGSMDSGHYQVVGNVTFET